MYTRIKPEELVHKVSALATTHWSTVVNNSKNIQDILKRRADRVTGGDLFTALYHWEPEFKEDVPDTALAAWIKQTAGTNAFQELRNTTVGSRELAAGATISLYRELMRAKESMFKAVVETKHSIDQMAAMGDINQGPMAEQIADTIKQAQEVMAETINSTPSRDSYNEPNKEQYSGWLDHNIIQNALSHANETVQMAQELAAFGGGGQGIDGPTDSQVLAAIDSQLLDRITQNDNLRKVFQIAGRMRVILQQAKSRKPRQAPTPVSVVTGRDISSMLSGELATLCDPDTEDKFYSKYLDGALLQYDHKSRINEGLGPFICLMDISGSMSGEPLRIAQALYVSLARMAVEKGRKVFFVPFASYTGEFSNTEVTTSELLVSTLTRKYNLGNGTNFKDPLEYACTYINEQDVYKQADIVLITDGVAYLNQDFIDGYIESKRNLGFRLVGLNVVGSMWKDNQLPMFDAVAHIEHGELSKLDWMHNLSDSLV